MFWGEKSLSTLIRQKVFGLRNAIHDPLFRHGPDRSGFLPYFQSARLLIVAGEARKAGVTENRVDLEFNLVGLPRMLRRQFGVQSPEEANMGVLQWRMAFDEVGISVAWRITLGKPFRGRLAYCNLRLPDADFQADPKRPGWRAAAGVQWRCEPEPSHVEWTPAAGSDLDVLFARAWRSWSGVGEAEGGFRIEFSDEA